jgi:predicted nucleic acid-binding protein
MIGEALSKLLPPVSGLDTNILCYALDPAFPEHKKASVILKFHSAGSKIAVNPTVIHETYHTLVYKQKWVREEASDRLLSLIGQSHVSFLNQTKFICRNAVHLANKYEIGGRDALILSNYLFNNISQMQTHDHRILDLGKISVREKELVFNDPVR